MSSSYGLNPMDMPAYAATPASVGPIGYAAPTGPIYNSNFGLSSGGSGASMPVSYNHTLPSADYDIQNRFESNVKDIINQGQSWETIILAPFALAPDKRIQIITQDVERTMASARATLTAPQILGTSERKDTFYLQRYTIAFPMIDEFEPTPAGQRKLQALMAGVALAFNNAFRFNVMLAMLTAHEQGRHDPRNTGWAGQVPVNMHQFACRERDHYDLAHKDENSFNMSIQRTHEILPQGGTVQPVVIISKQTSFLLKNVAQRRYYRSVVPVSGKPDDANMQPMDILSDAFGMQYLVHAPIDIKENDLAHGYQINLLSHPTDIGEYYTMEDDTACIHNRDYNSGTRDRWLYDGDGADGFVRVTINDALNACLRFDDDGNLSPELHVLAQKLNAKAKAPRTAIRRTIGGEPNVYPEHLADMHIRVEYDKESKPTYYVTRFVGEQELAFLPNSCLQNAAETLAMQVRLTTEQQEHLSKGKELMRHITEEADNKPYWRAQFTDDEFRQNKKVLKADGNEYTIATTDMVNPNRLILNAGRFPDFSKANDAKNTGHQDGKDSMIASQDVLDAMSRYKAVCLIKKARGDSTTYPPGFASWRQMNMLAFYDERPQTGALTPTGWKKSIFTDAKNFVDAVRALFYEVRRLMPDSAFVQPEFNYEFNYPRDGLSDDFLAQEAFFTNLFCKPHGPIFARQANDKTNGTITSIRGYHPQLIQKTIANTASRLTEIHEKKGDDKMGETELNQFAAFLRRLRQEAKTWVFVNRICAALLSSLPNMVAGEWAAVEDHFITALKNHHASESDIDDSLFAELYKHTRGPAEPATIKTLSILGDEKAIADLLQKDETTNTDMKTTWTTTPMVMPLTYRGYPGIAADLVDPDKAVITIWDPRSKYHLIPLTRDPADNGSPLRSVLGSSDDSKDEETKTTEKQRMYRQYSAGGNADEPDAPLRHLPIQYGTEGGEDEYARRMSNRLWPSTGPTLDPRVDTGAERRRRERTDEWDPSTTYSTKSAKFTQDLQQPYSGIIEPQGGVFASVNMRYRFKYFEEHSDPLVSVMARVLMATPINKGLYQMMISKNIRMLPNFLLLRKDMLFNTDAMIVVKPGSETMNSVWKDSRFAHGDSALNMRQLYNFAVWENCLVWKRQNIVVLPDYCVTKYVRGCGVDFVTDPKRELNGADGPTRSLIAIMLPPNERISMNPIDATGKFPAQAIGNVLAAESIMSRDTKPHYSTAMYYNQVCKFRVDQTNRTYGRFDTYNMGVLNNTVCWRGSQQPWNRKETTRNTSPIGETYDGVGSIRNGAPSRHPPRVYDSQTRIVGITGM